LKARGGPDTRGATDFKLAAAGFVEELRLRADDGTMKVELFGTAGHRKVGELFVVEERCKGDLGSPIEAAMAGACGCQDGLILLLRSSDVDVWWLVVGGSVKVWK
jgi:hypothetical protein